METILMMSFPVVQKGDNIETQVITITTSGFGASVKGEKIEVLKILRKKMHPISESNQNLLSALCVAEQQQAVGHLVKQNKIT